MQHVAFLVFVIFFTSFPRITLPIRQSECPDAPPSRMTVGIQGRVMGTSGMQEGLLRLRMDAGTAASGQMDLTSGDTFTVIGGPACADGLWWWQLVTSDGISGWAEEGTAAAYFIEPISDPPPDPLPSAPDRLIGTIPDRSPRALAWSPDGQTLAVSNVAGVWLYNAELKPLRLVEGLDMGVMEWSPDGQTLAGGSADGSLEVWNMSSDERRTLTGHPNAVLDLSWSPDSTRLVSVSDETMFRVWDVASGEQIAAPALNMYASAIDWQPGGSLIAVRYHLKPESQFEVDNSFVEIWDADTLTLKISADQVDTFQYMSGPGGLAWSPDGQWLMVPVDFFQLWNPVTGEQTFVDHMLAGNAMLYGYDWASDSRHLIWSVASFPIGPYDPNGGGSSLVFNEAGGDSIWGDVGRDIVRLIAARPGTNEFAVIAGWTLQLWTWDGTALVLSGSVPDFENPPFSWAETPPPVLLIQIEETEGGLNVKDITTGQVRATISDPDPLECQQRLGYSISPDGELLATFCTEHAFIWDTSSGELVTPLWYATVCPSDRESITSQFHWVNNSQYLYFEGRNGGCFLRILTVWKTSTGERVFYSELDDPNSSSASVAIAWSPDYTRLATAASDKLQIIDTATWEIQNTFPVDVYPLAWSPDSARIALSLDSRAVQIWDAATGEVLMILNNPIPYLNLIAWSPDGSRLATVEPYGTHIWDTNTGRMLMTLPTSGRYVVGLLWKPDGTRIASTDSNGNVMIWDVQ